MINKSSIQAKIMSAILLTCTIVLLLLCSAFILFEYLSYKKSVKDNVSTLARVIAGNSSAALAFESYSDAREILNGLKNNPHIESACLYDASGHVFAVYPDTISRKKIPPTPQTDGYKFSDNALVGFEPVRQEASRLGTMYIRSNLDQMYAQLNNLLLTSGCLLVGLLLVTYLLSVLMQRPITRPIRAFKDGVRRISEEHDYSVRITQTSQDELGSLTDAFNHMLTQIELQNETIGKLAAIVESSNDPIISITLEGIITSWNDAAERTFGYAADEIIGKSVFNIVPDERRHEEAEILARLQRGESVEHLETQRLTKNNRLLDILLTISPVKDQYGKIIGASKISRDITEKKQEERRKNDFIAMVSHELKTPLTSTRSYVQILLAEARKRNSDAFIINALTRTDVQTKKMTHMINDFLNLARLEEGKLQLILRVFELQTLVEEIVGDAQFLTKNHKISFLNCDHIKVKADREKIGQVLMNLLTNAIKYSPKGGEITVACAIDNQKAIISVRDQGVGIKQADQQKLFERFYRVENNELRTISGFGIGLYLVAEILRYHGSKIQVESQEGFGSTFYFSLDIAQE